MSTNDALAPKAAAAVTRLAYSPSEAARALSLSRATVYNLMSDGQLSSVKIGRRRCILADELSRFLSDLPVA